MHRYGFSVQMTSTVPVSFDQSLQRASTQLQRGQINEAIERLRALLREQPESIPVLHLLGIAQRRAGYLDQALQIQQGILAREPDFAAAFQEIGLCHRTAGRVAEAQAAFRRAVGIDPRLANSWKFLGDLALEQGDADAALECIARIPAEDGRDPVLERIVELLEGERLGKAEKLARAYLERHPTNAKVLYLQSRIATRLGAVTDAMRALEATLSAEQRHVDARYDYVNLLSRRQRYREALAQADRLLADAPGEPRFRVLKAALLDRSGSYREAAAILKGLLKEDPSQAHIWTGLATLQRTLGERADAIASLHRAIDAQPARGEAWYQLADLKVYRFTGAQMQAMRTSAEHAPPGSEDEIHFCFALGRALEQREEWDLAFEYYARGNRARRGSARWDPAQHEALIAALREVADPGLFERLDGAGCPDPAPIFIVGLPRAGSTLVDQIVTAHSQVDGTMELPILASLVQELNYRQGRQQRPAWPQALQDLDAGACRALGEEYLERARILRGNRPYFVDKMPNNFEYAALIRLALPNARIIDVRREPLANGFSAWRQLFRTGQEWSYDLEDIGRYTRAYRDLMAHWDRVLPGAVHHVQYERLVEQPRQETEALLAFLDLPVEPACFEPQSNPRAVRTASSEQVRLPLYREALEHWKHFERHLGPLREALGDGGPERSAHA